jgi:hypothetical protein
VPVLGRLPWTDLSDDLLGAGVDPPIAPDSTQVTIARIDRPMTRATQRLRQ